MSDKSNHREPSGLLAFTFALPEESKDLVAGLSEKQVVVGGALPVISGKLGGRNVLISHSGVGTASCRARIGDFLQKHTPATLVSSGFAGGLDPALKVGDLILATNFSDATLPARASGVNAVSGKMTTETEVAETVAGKRALFEKTGAIAVDMETAIIAELCAQRSIPMLSLRGISDAAGDQLPVSFDIWFDAARQQPRVGALLWELATHPGKIPAFVRFVQGINLARRNLTAALVAVASKL